MAVSVGMIVTMAGIGVASAIGEKVLISFGKSEMASFLNITGLCGIGLTAIGIVVKLLSMLSSLA